ncbi:hypothetical protein FGRMN_1809 [Fusarium graminum]|nr:hypothetical protein FGRMN_1809 [Fusarium graminum]
MEELTGHSGGVETGVGMPGTRDGGSSSIYKFTLFLRWTTCKDQSRYDEQTDGPHKVKLFAKEVICATILQNSAKLQAKLRSSLFEYPSMPDESARRVPLDGFPLVITIIVSIFLGLAIIAVSIRLPVRWSDGTFGADDWLILAGTLTYIAGSALAVHGASVGIGSKDKDTNTWLAMEGQKIFLIWIAVYVVSVALIRSSVCVTLRRIADTAAPVLRCAIWLLFGITWASCVATFSGILAFCRPIQAFWDPILVSQGKATCGGGEALIGLSYTNTATSIITDLGCILVPAFLLWKTQMSLMSKMHVLSLLSLASVASIATIVRAPFISYFLHPEDNLRYHIGYIVLFSCIEIGVVCITTSLPCMLILYKRWRGQEVQRSTCPPNLDTIITIGGGKIGGENSEGPKHVFCPADRGTTLIQVNSGDVDWDRLSDEHSQKGILDKGMNGGIRVDYTISVELDTYNTGTRDPQ